MGQALMDYRCYSHDEIETILKNCAALALVGNMYVGRIGEQTLRWVDGGGVEVLTSHEPQTLPPPVPQPAQRRGRRR